MSKQNFGTTSTANLVQQVSDTDQGNFVGQPCLVVGTGGIGHRIVLALKAQLVSIFGTVPAGIRLLALDIDEENLSMRVGDEPVSLERDVELICLGAVPVARIKRNLDNLPTVRNRLPCLRNLPSIAAAHAARQLRPLGQLAFQWQFPRIHALVRDTIWTLAGRDQRGNRDLAVDPSRGLKIIEAGSLCGGTNAGMFIDLGYLLRHEVESLGNLGESCDIIGVGMLPSAFRGVDGPNLVPNTVASLLELETVTMDGDFAPTYRDGTVLEIARSPYDMYLLVDALDEGGRVWVRRDDLCQMVARSILVLVATNMGKQSEGVLDNLDEVLSQRTPDGHGTFFGSLGLSVLEFPAAALVEYFAARHGQAVIDDTLSRQVAEAEVETNALSWLQLQGISAEILLTELAQDKEGHPLAVVIEPPAGLRRLPKHRVPGEALQFVQAYERLRLDGDFRTWTRRRAETLTEQLVAELETQIGAMLNDPRRGLAHSRLWLEVLRGRLSDLHVALCARRERVKAEEIRSAIEVKDAEEALIQAPEGLSSWLRRGPVTSALDRYVQASQDRLSARLDGLVLDQVTAVIGALAEKGCELERSLTALETRLGLAAARLAQRAERYRRQLGRRKGNAALVLLDESYVEWLYDRHAPESFVTLAATLTACQEGMLGWGSLEPEAIAEMVERASRKRFDPIRAMTIEDVVAARDEFSPQARLAALKDEAQPAWNLDETRLPGGDASLKRIMVVGVPNSSHTIFSSSGDQLVSIHDPHRVTVLSLTIGAPYTALQAWLDYRAEYERVRRLRPLHTLPAFQVEGQESGLALALGLIFSLIHTRGVHFYYRPADELASEIRLAQGAANAVQALATREGLIRELMERVEAQIEHIGIGQALEQLGAYYAPHEGDDDLARELKRLVRSYAETLRANARVAGGRM